MNEIVKKNIQAYDDTVEEYYSKTKKLEPIQIHIREEFLSLLNKGGKILDVGCGPGRDTKFFSDRGFKVVGIDLSPKSIEMAKRIEPRANFEIMDFLDIKYPEKSFSGAWFSGGLLSVEKKHASKILNNINRVLTDRGILYISVKEGNGEGFELDKRYNKEKYYAYYQEGEIKQLLGKSGFKILKIIRPKLKSKYHTHQWLFIFCSKEPGPSPE